MYLAVAATIVVRPSYSAASDSILYAGAFVVLVVAFVSLYEEPTLRARYGDENEAYRRSVPGWLPRRRPWPGGG